MRTHEDEMISKLQRYYDDESLWSRGFLSGGTHFGIMFADMATAIRFADRFRANPY